MKRKLDIYKVIAYMNVYGTQIYGYKSLGLDAGRNNMESYFCNKLGWTKSKLKNICKELREAGVIDKMPSDPDCTCYKITSMYKVFLHFLEPELA